MAELIPFFIIFTVGLLFTEVSNRFNIPYVTALILAGVILGGLEILSLNDSIEFIGSIGLVFLMFIAGSKINLKSLLEEKKEVIVLTLVNSLVPFLTGFLIGSLFFEDTISAVILGVIFISSSVAVVIPILDNTGFIKSKLGRIILASTVIQDIFSLLILATLLQTNKEGNLVSSVTLLIGSIFVVIVLRDYLPKIESWFLKNHGGKDLFESELRFTLVVLFSTVILFEIMGLHSIVAAFIVGIILSEVSKKDNIIGKIRILSYGIFIPIFFFIVGMQTDLSVFTSFDNVALTVSVVVGLFISKIVGGFVGLKILGFTDLQAFFAGVSMTPQLSTTLAVAFTALSASLIDNRMITSLVVLTLTTSIFSPVLMRLIADRLSKRTLNTRKSEGQMPAKIEE